MPNGQTHSLMNPERNQTLTNIALQCKSLLGLNFDVLLQPLLEQYRKAIENSQTDEAAQAAFSVTQTLFNQQQFELQQQCSLFFIQDLNTQKLSIYTGEIYRLLALNYTLSKQHEAAEKTYTEAFAHLTLAPTEDQRLKWKIFGSLWYNRASPARSQESKEKLVVYTRNALHFFEHLNDVDGMSLCLNRLALLLPENQYTEKFELLRRILSINSGPKGNKKNITMARFNIGFCTYLSGEENLGIAYMTEAISLIEQYLTKRHVGMAHLQMANAFLKHHKKVQAIDACQKALQIFKNADIALHIAEAQSMLQKIESLP